MPYEGGCAGVKVSCRGVAHGLRVDYDYYLDG
jgi:hypothetical protein